jgi:UDP-N-acetylglucosamine:LPS N-acetylglucosamine transferase
VAIFPNTKKKKKKKMKKIFLFAILIFLFFKLIISKKLKKIEENCDVIIGGGSLSAIAAGIASASNGVLTCLIEPTDWIGGQLTSSGVPAVDFAWFVKN